MVCIVCEEFRSRLESMGSLDPERPEVETQWRLHDEHADALEIRCCNNRVKAIKGENNNPGRKKYDMSLGSDGLGSFALKWLPHKQFFGMHGMTRDSLLGIHTELTMVHNYGVFAYVSFPGLERSGGNMSLNSIYRAIYLSLKGRPHFQKIRNLYVSLDNTISSNKCWSMMHGMASLVALGIAERVMVTYRLVGHTKNEVDQAGGIVSTTIRHKNMLTLEKWKEEVENAMRSSKKKTGCFNMRSVEFCEDGCPDYAQDFKHEYSETSRITGLARVQEVRFAMHPTDDYVEMHYKSHYLSRGWLPR